MATMYGDLVRRLRERRDLSQRGLAEVSGVPQPNIAAIESGRRLPTADTLNRLVVACGFELAAVAGDEVIPCALPKVGWFPDEDRPPALPDDPPDEAPVIGPDSSMEDRLMVIDALSVAAGELVRAKT